MANDVEEDGLFFRFWVSRGSALLGKAKKNQDKKTTNLLCVRFSIHLNSLSDIRHNWE
jgi:hypothetical protein